MKNICLLVVVVVSSLLVGCGTVSNVTRSSHSRVMKNMADRHAETLKAMEYKAEEIKMAKEKGLPVPTSPAFSPVYSQPRPVMVMPSAVPMDYSCPPPYYLSPSWVRYPTSYGGGCYQGGGQFYNGGFYQGRTYQGGVSSGGRFYNGGTYSGGVHHGSVSTGGRFYHGSTYHCR